MWLRLPEPDQVVACEHLRNAIAHLQIALKEVPNNGHYRKILGDATKTLNDVQPERRS
jgi:hypothetical protein